jgi:hypothetical protein
MSRRIKAPAGREGVVVANAFAAPGNVNVLYAPLSGAPVALSAGGDRTAVAISDRDGNTRPDVAVANRGSIDLAVLSNQN